MVENSQPFSSGAKPKEIQFILIHKYSGIRSNECSLPYKTEDLREQ
jgi:hypothetical protein